LLLATTAAGLATLDLWPSHRDVRQHLLPMGAALTLGLASGGILAALDSSWRRRAAATDRPTDARLALLEAVDGFSHAQWAKHLGGVAMLARGLTEGADPALVLPRLQSRMKSYDEVIQPQMRRIAEVLPAAGLDPALRRRYEDDLAAIEQGMLVIRRSGFDPAAGGALRDLADAALRVRATLDQMFHALGAELRTDVRTSLESAVERTRQDFPEVELRLSHQADVPPVFGEPGELANIFENLVVNAARAAMAAVGLRSPRVEIEVLLEGSLLRVLVRDTGLGLPREKLDEAANHRALDPGGHGRGLAYALRRLRPLDGNLQILSSCEDQGTVMAVSLRTLAPARPEPAASGVPPENHRGQSEHPDH